MALSEIKEGDWITTEHLSGPARVVAVQGGVVKVRYRGGVYFLKESEVKKA